jgi:hypothetical protein
MWKFPRRAKRTPDTTEPQRVIADAKAAQKRACARGEYVEEVADRLQTRIEKNHFSESLALAWRRNEGTA